MTGFEGAPSKGVNRSPEDVLGSFREMGGDGDNELVLLGCESPGILWACSWNTI